MGQEQSELIKKALFKIQSLKEELARYEEPIVVVGMSCRFPGGINTPQDFWQLLIENREGLCPPPKERWDHALFYDPLQITPNSIYIKESSFLQTPVDRFDAKFFGISPREAEEIDPQHRFLLELSWEAFEDAGVIPSTLKGKKVGFFVGIISSEYAGYDRDGYETSPYYLTGIMTHMASGRIAYFYGTHGPAISLDTSCSSSLVAFHLACRSLQTGESEMALVGGINLMISPYAITSLCQLNALSRDGRCKPFEANADGYGRSEGGGFLLLKRLSDALRDKDRIYAVVKGSAVNHDGRSKGLTVPNQEAQVQVMKEALAQAKLDPSSVSYIEAHGTGTEVGDPLEIQAIERVFGSRQGKALPIGSVKANIGHTEAAAGLAGLMKTILCMQHKTIPAQINFCTLNPAIQLDSIPAYIPIKNESWDSQSRIASINSFGFSGTNAHVILEEWKSPPLSDPLNSFDEPPYFLPISAKSIDSLSAYVDRYLQFLKETPHSLSSIQNAACLRRSSFKHRLVLLGHSKEDFIQQLEKLQKEGVEGHLGKLSDISLSLGAKREIIEAYLAGQTIDWEKVLPGASCKQVPLPTYPFSPQAYWFKKQASLKETQEGPPLKGTKIISPLSHYQHQFFIGSGNLKEVQDTHGLLHVGQILEMIYAMAKGKYALLAEEVSTSEVSLERALLVGEGIKIYGLVEGEQFSLQTLDQEWRLHLQGKIHPHRIKAEVQPAMGSADGEISRDQFYESLRQKGVDLGPSVQWVERAYCEDTRIRAMLIPFNNASSLHRGIFDALAQLFHLWLGEEKARLLVTGWEASQLLLSEAEGPFEALLERQGELIGDVYLFDREKRLVFFWKKLQMKKLAVSGVESQAYQTELQAILEASEKKELCQQLIQKLIGKWLNVTDFPLSASLYDIGFDSIMGIELVHQLKTLFRIEINMEKFFENPSIESCVEQVLTHLSTRNRSQHPWFKGNWEQKEMFRLYCFPYGAGGASEYSAWEKQLSHLCQVIPIQLPGREDRLEELPFDDMGRLMEALEAVFPTDETPFAFYGHSIGALMAYALTLHLQKKGKRLPTHLIVGAYSSPTIQPNPWLETLVLSLKAEGIFPLPTLAEPLLDAQLEKAILALTRSTSREYIELKMDFFKKILPSIWADLHLVRSFSLPSDPKVQVPIVALAGIRDDRVTVEEMQAWKALTLSDFALHPLEGDHFFLRRDSAQTAVLEIIEKTIGQMV